MFQKKKLALHTAVLSSLVVLGGCLDDDDNTVTAPQPTAAAPMPGEIRVIHASVDAPAVNISLDGTVAISDLDFAESSGYAELDAGMYDIAVDGITPSGDVTVIEVADFEIGEGAAPTVIAVGDVASIEPIVVSHTMSEPTSDEVSLVVVHAASVAPEVGVYLTGPMDDITGTEPAFSFDFKDSVDVGAVAAGEVRIRVTLGSDVVFDSGTVDLTGFAGQDLLVAAIPAENQVEMSASPIKLLVATDSAHLELLDVDTTTGVKVVHASPDANAAAGGGVEVYASATVLGMDPAEVIDTFDYLDTAPSTSSYLEVPAGAYTFDVAPNTGTIGDSVFTSGELNLDAGMEYTAIASGRVLSSPAFGLLATGDQNRAIATQASVKVVHAAPAAGTVDVYVTAAGMYSTAEVESGMAGAPLLDDFEYAAITDYVAVAPGDYDIRVVAGGVTAINIEGFTLAGGTVASVIARGPTESSTGPTDFGVIVLTN